MINVLVVDDHDLVRTGISSLLEDSPTLNVIGCASTGEEALALARNLKPHVILMDLRMPGMGGLEATRKIMQRLPDTKIIAVTACDDTPFPERLFEAGAQGFITKGSSKEEMLTAITAVMRGEKYISNSLAGKIALNKVANLPDCPFSVLSGRELEVCLMIASGQKVQDVSDTLCVSPKTINTYRYRVFEKLNIHNDVALALLAIKHGLIEVQA